MFVFPNFATLLFVSIIYLSDSRRVKHRVSECNKVELKHGPIKKRKNPSKRRRRTPWNDPKLNGKNRNSQTRASLSKARHAVRVADKDGSFARNGAIAGDLTNDDYQKEDWTARKRASKRVSKNKKVLSKRCKRNNHKYKKKPIYKLK